jgi:uncharacterized protein (TIGR00725 family)
MIRGKSFLRDFASFREELLIGVHRNYFIPFKFDIKHTIVCLGMYNKTIAVIGAGECDQKIWQTAEELGGMLARSGYKVVCGGLGGVMEAVCKGAKAEKGITIGILPGDNPTEANPYVDIAIATGMGIGRNLMIIRSAEAVISINGGFGTLSEISFALQMNKPVVGINTWDVSDLIEKVNNPAEAMKKIVALIELI